MSSSFNQPDATGDALVASLARSAAAGPALGDVLRAVAEESDSRSLARQLRRLATAVDRGQPLDSALAAAAPNMRADVRGLLQASQRTGNLPATLAQWLDHRRASAAYWRDTLRSLTYPLLAALAGFCVFLLYSWFVVPPVQRMLTEFGLKLGASTRAVFWCSEYGASLAVSVLVTLLVVSLGIRVLGGAAAWSRTVAAMPVFGDLWHWSNVTEMLRSLRLLVESRVPLPEALELTASSIRDRHVGQSCELLARLVREGQSLDVAAEATSLPRSILPLLCTGRQQASLPEALGLATRLLESRLRSTSQLVAALAPAVIFVLLAVLVGGMYIGLMIPMYSLIQGLT